MTVNVEQGIMWMEVVAVSIKALFQNLSLRTEEGHEKHMNASVLQVEIRTLDVTNTKQD
jgi:hypothetical protein